MNYPFFRDASLEVCCILTRSAWDDDDELTEDALIEFFESVSPYGFCDPDLGDPVQVRMQVPADRFESFYASVGRGEFGADVHLQVLNLVLRPVIEENETSDGVVYYTRGKVTLLETDHPDVTFRPNLDVPKSFKRATVYDNSPSKSELANTLLATAKVNNPLERGEA